MGVGRNGETYNINADLVAGHVAAALSAEKLILLTDVDGVMDAEGRLLETIRSDAIEDLKSAGVVRGGMIPKLDCCAEALARGVKKAHIVNGRKLHAVLLELFTDRGIGTQVVGRDEE